MEQVIRIKDREIPVNWHSTLVVGSGCAGYNAANRLLEYGEKDVVLLTENRRAGTSRNTGSDKQTYYKLTLSGKEPDSVLEMGKTLYAGMAVDGPIALAEAASSVQCFLNLVELGVPFPRNRYGGFIGYKTDHDPRERGTSVGPLTSRKMTERLEEKALSLGLQIRDHHLVVAILADKDTYKGVLVLDTAEGDPQRMLKLYLSHSIVYATGGPANIYKDSVYPHGHYGMSGIALEAGVKGRNLTEWQYGLASLRPRWNVSGTYMQVLPRLISTDKEGENGREFLLDYFQDQYEALSQVFLKGYQWPFDIRKAQGGSSLIDLLVYTETKLKGRRVFLDYRENPFTEELDFEKLHPEARDYLKKAGAAFGTPLERLLQMNPPAYQFYLDRGVDLKVRPLEIALSAQHNNGGLAMNEWWQTNLEGFFAAGEVAGSHGIYRPGGSALNAGQVGSLRAAKYISAHRAQKSCPLVSVQEYLGDAFDRILQRMDMMDECTGEVSNVKDLLTAAQERMSAVGAPIRDSQKIRSYLEELTQTLQNFRSQVSIASEKELPELYRLYDVYLSQLFYLTAMTDYADQGGKSRGSSLYFAEDGEKPLDALENLFRFHLDPGTRDEEIQEIQTVQGKLQVTWRRREPLPVEEEFFENVWRDYREHENIV
ncbi:FAD-binding protein [Proteiniclasticum sp. BAD-10]|uniref:FAD-binding protein n=1 Tax=Proteiniclasticum sediminis TaxID=2804028 RepID=A0A941HS42_9CLOT|nr:FAD-binding protein [Proteiniclasticum sediminis]MBR0576897.1 FAD-binding protein [Proteiniclasticum sediminis]